MSSLTPHGFGLNGSKEMWTRLINLYARNPLALKLISGPIREVFQGDINAFLDEGEHLVGDVSQLVEQQFERASPLEQEILYWLAIEREKTSLDTLRANIVQSVPRRDLLEALSSLRRRSLVEPGCAVIFFLQPVILEYVTNRLVTQFSEELSGGKSIELLHHYALLKAQAKDYVRASQVRFLLEPTANYLQRTLGEEESERSLRQILATMQSASARRPDYAAGNILNLLIALHVDLRGYDFSHLIIKQAYLQDAQLTDVNLAYADLATSTFTATFGNILSLALDASGQLLAAGTANGKVELWHLPEGTPYLTLDIEGHDEWVRAVAFSPQGDLLASGNDDETVCLWDVASGQQLAVLRAHSGRVYSVAFSPHDNLLASGGDDHVIHIWNTRTVVSDNEDCTLHEWNVASGEGLRAFRKHTSWIYATAYSPDGRLLATGSDDQEIHLWDVKSGAWLRTLRQIGGRVRSVAFSPDSKLLATGGDDQDILLWDSASG